MAKLVSKTYGDALFDVALESGRFDAFLEEAKGVVEILNTNDEFVKLMNHPKIGKEEKGQIIENIFKERISDEIVGLMRMIVAKDHFGEMESVFSYFIEQVKESKNIGTAYVTTAVELSEEQRKQVLDRLIQTTKYVEFEMHYNVDTAIIGGLVIRIGDRVIDSSIKTKLYGLTRELSKIQLKVGECAP